MLRGSRGESLNRNDGRKIKRNRRRMCGGGNGLSSFHQFFSSCLPLDSSKCILNLSDVRGERNLCGLVEGDKDIRINSSRSRKTSLCSCYELFELVCLANLHSLPSPLHYSPFSHCFVALITRCEQSCAGIFIINSKLPAATVHLFLKR